MNIKTHNLQKDISEEYTWEYIYKGTIFFWLGSLFIWVKLGRFIYKIMLLCGKLTWKFIEKSGKKNDKKQNKKN